MIMGSVLLFRFSHVEVEVTDRCNLACRQCYASSNRELRDPPLDLVLSILKRLRELNTEGVLLCGGEPTIRDDLGTIIKYCNDINLPVVLSTNGLVNSKTAEIITENNLEVDVSIRGSSKEEFEYISQKSASYIGMRRGIKKLSNAGVKININYDITNYNYKNLWKSIAELVDDGIKMRKIWIQRVSARGRANSQVVNDLSLIDLDKYYTVFEQMIAIEKEYGIKPKIIDPIPLCLIPSELRKYIMDSRYGYDWAAVNSSGFIRRDAVDPDSIVSSIFEHNLLQIWNDNEKLVYFRSLRWLPEKCEKCRSRHVCKGGFIMSNPAQGKNNENFVPDILVDRYMELITPL